MIVQKVLIYQYFYIIIRKKTLSSVTVQTLNSNSPV